ncbi:exopolysaccharide transport family protein [Pedobacter heparinus]|uniref:Lipopolysaccharide biosynthesis protein n=1 Tax=Pedobacter heparinus (strain ATCC 13125 / DSM 2366 / CIP 104194 / JCM 7457 / NBRC 12017 / NCIMB 9290 / NRRL B-14731 / HIM 762-3) TaxID=485917 RepID=C6XW87_PEDHD|nr:Wzz/FepE/Etk N-terminal domain-containing protein [Pedobacter heparinus]ACU04166.1 lipopolysaccharide biosynthesis protein [Pedobacter heparinus DSM 2366]
MDIKRFSKILKKFSWILILLPVIAGTLTYFLSKNLPKKYKSEAQIATGLVDQSKQISTQVQSDFFKISQQFSNIIEKMKMRKMMGILSYHLIIHDLENPSTAFRKNSSKIDSLSQSDKSELINIYKKKLSEKATITVLDNRNKFKLFDLLQSMGYDEASINEDLTIYRAENSDFINVQFTSEDPLLSAFVVNTLSTEFINNYSVEVYNNQNNSILLLDSLLKKKEQDMNAKNSALKDFKMKNGVLNVNEQGATLYAQISQYEEKKAQAIRDIQANLGALSAINKKLSGKDEPFLGGSAIEDNNNILNLKSQIKTANDRYIDGGFKVADKKKVDSLQNLLSIQSSKVSDKNVTDPLVPRQGLVQQKINLEVSTDQIKNTIKSIDRELATLKAKYSTMVPFDAGIQNYERDADIATKDYMAALDRTNQSRTEQNTGLKLQIAQIGLPGTPEKSKAILFIAMSAAASFMLCFVILLILFLLDRSVYTTAQLAKQTGGPVLGLLNLITESDKEPKTIWKDKGDNLNYNVYKDLLRSVRFEIDKAFGDSESKILGITSLNIGEGKSFLASSLTYAFAMTGKKVLLISSEEDSVDKDGSQKLIPSEFVGTFIVKKEVQTEDLITVFNMKSSNSSLLETQSSANIKNGFDLLRKEFDYIIIDINNLKDVNNTKEWLYFTDRSIAVFEYGKSIGDGDAEYINYIRNHPGFMGWILNKFKYKKK